MSAVLALAGLLLGAASPPAEVTLEEALQLLEQHAPRLEAERQRVEVARAEVIAAGVAPNPALSYGADQLIGGTNTGAATAHSLSVEQPLLLFGQRGARVAAAEREVAATGAEVTSTIAERRQAVRAAFAALLSRQERVGVLDETLADLERVEGVVKARAAAGDRSRYDSGRIEVEVRSVRAELLDARADVADASGRLAFILGFPGWTPRARAPAGAMEVPDSFQALWERARARRPSLVAAERRLEAARAALASAKSEAWPVPSIGGGAVLTRDASSTQVSVGLSVPLPFFDRNQGGVARAAAGVRSQALAAEAELAEARAELFRAHSVLSQRRAALAAFQQVLDALPSLRTMAEAAYREGNSGILELVDAVRSRKELRLRWVDETEAVKIAEADLVAAAGLDAPAP